MPFVAEIVPDDRRRRRPRRRRAARGPARPRPPDTSTASSTRPRQRPAAAPRTERAHRRRLDLPRLPRAAAALAGRQGASTPALLDLRVHDLRDRTHDRHRTVDDTPYGGGPGMVMKPEPWGEALDAILADATRPTRGSSSRPRAGAGSPRRWPPSSRPPTHLVFACGRYEGIDSRVVDHYADQLRGRRGLDRRLRAGRRRGRRPGHGRGRRPAAARRARQPRAASSTTRSPRAPWPRCSRGRSTPSRPSGAGSTVPDVLLSGDHGADRRAGAASRPSPAPSASGPTSLD